MNKIRHFAVFLTIGIVFTKSDASDEMYINDLSNSLDENEIIGNGEQSTRSLNAEDVMFLLYTQNSIQNEQIIRPTIEALKQSDFNPKKITKIVTHGFQSSGKSDTCQLIKNEYLKTNDYNVIIVDWKSISSNPFYFIPAQNTKSIGDYCGRFVELLIKYGTNPKEIHLIGHSLGAHISGFAGLAIKSGKVGRVTGLDPAYPSFGVIQLAGGRLSTNAADFVDIIHSCGGVLGIYEPIGHVDFYPNGGTMPQPGCESLADMAEACSHGRSWQYFKESINGDIKFKSYQCSTYADYRENNCSNVVADMGEHVSYKARGIFYLKTNSKSIFALGTRLKRKFEKLKL